MNPVVAKYTSKYALSRGIMRVEVYLSRTGHSWFNPDNCIENFKPSQIHDTLEEARVAAVDLAVKKAISLEKQLYKARQRAIEPKVHASALPGADVEDPGDCGS